ncbi:chitooligosaccharidolytic beta-N-acetylglucosaminidase-like [Adelges cooleyi]|uniref:chitooligosaccharidolytic beta-N-acetylglucosaminidase-like n=1 Tax=Adelges cooleyi TaxID=133065 RepID=UPI00217F3340|nr:chitooligosaccharidolytic beta-N-acetylglucosaminidase-like [Adelges cooleyi]XP_050421398.1 chitooligosaccharidolytic beta-N-acetylglucosaminidase-like [Adelges cooleyi]
MARSTIVFLTMKKIIASIVVSVLLFKLVNCNDYDNDNQWPNIGKAYACVNGTCVLAKFQTTENENGQLNGSLEVCRMVCGQSGSLWPIPTVKTSIGKSVVVFGLDKLKFDFTRVAGVLGVEYLKEASQVFVDCLKKLCNPKCVTTVQQPIVYVNTSAPFDNIRWNTDESYQLDIITRGDQTAINISAPTVYGARHGIETLRQLIATYGSRSSGKKLAMAANVHIVDRPKYPHRGFMLDTSRRFFSISSIKRIIDGMGHSKLNVFHWHATDTHSFPLDLPSVPQMSKYGAYSPEKTYSYGEIKNLLRYALIRGVRIIMEIDSPSHVGNGWQWGESAGLGNMVVCLGKHPWWKYCVQPPCGQLNPLNINTYKYLGKIYKDLIDLFPKGEAFHMGADEVAIQCWNTTTEIVDWMKTNKNNLSLESYFELWSEFQDKALTAYDQEVGNSDSDIIVWTSGITDSGIIEKYLDKNRYIVQVWQGSLVPVELANLGYKVILSDENIYYLDHGLRPSTHYHSWKEIYNTPIPIVNNPDLILGAETCLWTEYVDEFGLDLKVWPRAAAVAERFWSNPLISDTSSVDAAEYRLLEHRKRLISLGIQPESILPEWCEDQEGKCIVGY